MLEFSSSQALMRHYKEVRKRLNAGRPEVVVESPPPPPPESPPPPPPQPPCLNAVAYIARAAAAHFGVRLDEVTGRRRARRLVRARHIALYLSYQMTMQSTTKIGIVFGMLDHTSVLHGIRRVRERLDIDADLVADVEAVRDRAIALLPRLKGGDP